LQWLGADLGCRAIEKCLQLGGRDHRAGRALSDSIPEARSMLSCALKQAAMDGTVGSGHIAGANGALGHECLRPHG
jgi:hypothetical protein